jgi:P27 family predicted phage terminase small subunit
MAFFVDTQPPRGTLNSFGRSYYKRHFRRLVMEGVIKEADFDNWLELCGYYGELQQLRKDIKTEGEIIRDRDGNERRNPKQIRRKDVEAKFIRLSSRFGLDPAGRKRVKREPAKVRDVFDTFLEAGRWVDKTFQERVIEGKNVPVPENLREFFEKVR